MSAHMFINIKKMFRTIRVYAKPLTAIEEACARGNMEDITFILYTSLLF